MEMQVCVECGCLYHPDRFVPLGKCGNCVHALAWTVMSDAHSFFVDESSMGWGVRIVSVRRNGCRVSPTVRGPEGLCVVSEVYESVEDAMVVASIMRDAVKVWA